MNFPRTIFKKSGAFYNFARNENGAEILLYDAIGREGVSSKKFINDLASLKGERVTVRVNSPGGDVFEGLAIYNALKGHDGAVRVVVDALAASAASLVTMAGSEILMAKNAMMMIHDPFTLTIGAADDHRRQADLLDQVAEPLVMAYAEQTGASQGRLREMMQAETWMDAPTALRLGFVNEVVSPENRPEVAAAFDLSVYNRVPEGLQTVPVESKPKSDRTSGQVSQADIEKHLRQKLGLPKAAARRAAHGAWRELSDDHSLKSQAAADLAAHIDTLTTQV